MRMKGGRRSASFHRERPAGLSRAFSWLSLSSLSEHRRRIFRSQHELHVPSPSNAHPEGSDRDGDDDSWVYKPQHKIAVSNLDEESKWTVHYTAPWHQQENVFLPGSRPSCVEDLHRQAKVNLKTTLRECDKLRKDGFRSSQYYSQGPTFSEPLQSSSSLQDEEDEENDKKSIASSMEDDKSQLSLRLQERCGERGEMLEVDGQMVWNKAVPLPTPEERMRQAAQAVPTDIVPINVTGAVFDRQASIRRSLINTDTVSRRPKKVKRRKTISGLPDNFNQELAKGRGGELRPHSMFIPGQYSTLGRVGSVNSTLRFEKRDSSCQTEEVKIVPPSVRRIRAQRGQGIAAQMAGISASSSTGSISISSTDGLILPNQFFRDPSRFNSLPRQGARVSLSADPIYSSTPIKSEDQLQRNIGKFQVDETAVHIRNAPRTSTLPRPTSQEVRRTQSSEWGGGPACVVSPQAAYSTSFIPNATLSSSTDVITLSSSSHLSLSAVSALATSTPTRAPQENGVTPSGPPSESGHSDGSVHSHSTLAPTPPSCPPEEQWIYDSPENVVPHRTLTSSCSTPINQLYSSLDHSSRTDSSSLYSQDNDGYFTSMHMDSGLRSRSHGSGHGAGAGRSRHSMYECREMANREDSGSVYSDRSLSRSISLRKSKKPPPPPARTDSLRRKPAAKKPLGGVGPTTVANGDGVNMLNETFLASLQQSLQMGLRGSKGKGTSLSSPSHSPSSDYDDPWLLRPRSQSSISAGSSAASLANTNGVSNVYSLCHVTPTHSDTSSLRSDYAESWGYYMDYPRNPGDQGGQTPPAHATDNMSAGGHPGVLQNGGEIHSNTLTDGAPGQEGGQSGKPKPSSSSPDRVHRLTSPSSGYSSQSNTPTAGTPVPAFVRSMSPSSGSRPKPKVPERKSSLLSSGSVSSSSTSLSSNTSDSLKSSGPPLPPPNPLHLTSSTPNTPLGPPPPFPPPLPPNSTSAPSSPPPPPPLPNSPRETFLAPLSASPEFPPPPSPELLMHHSSSLNGNFSPPPPPETGLPPPPPLPDFTPAVGSPNIRKSTKNTPKPPPSKHSTESPKPLITPFALQSVQLRSVKQSQEEIAGELDQMKPQENGLDLLQEKLHSLDPSPIQEHTTVTSSSPDEELRESTPSPVTKLLEELSLDCSFIIDTQDSGVINGKAEDQSYCLSNGKDNEEELPLPSCPERCGSSSIKAKPPPVSKKPKLTFVPSQPISEPAQTQNDNAASLSPEDQVDAQTTNDVTKNRNNREEEASESTKASTEDLDQSCQDADLDHDICTNGEVFDEDEEEEEGEGASSTTGSISSKEEDTSEVFESRPAEPPSPQSAVGASEQKMVTPTPSKPRTTDDLFAVIHRSKRKVLGRRESDEDKSRPGVQAQSPPSTPSPVSPGPVSPSARQMGSIQRNLRKSATSSDNFKALLLRKGSRSENSFRMSATEMLRSTDPRFQRTRSESALDPPTASPTSPMAPHSPSASFGRSKRVTDEWSRYDALSSPTYSPGSKFGRPRAPPSAASSKYNTRSRILSSPMTVICEREGELTESESGEVGESREGVQTLPETNGTLSEESRG
uniref:NHS-like 1b n=1 Tax=Oryzias latipes TaxID=8090 RepID=A0A3P9M704_ORYLA